MSTQTSKSPRWLYAIIGTVLGPLGARGWLNKLVAVLLTLLLTLFTQVGGIILWPFWYAITTYVAHFMRWKRRGLQGLILCAVYLVGTQGCLPWAAQQTGRVRLPFFATATLPTGPLHWGYALLNRNYVQRHTYTAYTRAIQRFAKKHPGVTVRYLDAGFPFPTLPLLPHFSHRDGQRIDVAFLFEQNGVHVDRALSPIGYWGYVKESPARVECDGARRKWGPLTLDLRWDFDWLQPLWPNLDLDVVKNRALFQALAQEDQVCSILLEPTLHRTLRAPKLSSNSCLVARHDDHFHLTIRKRCR